MGRRPTLSRALRGRRLIRPAAACAAGVVLGLLAACRPTPEAKPAAAAPDYQPVNTQPTGAPLPPAEAFTRLRPTTGFQVTLAAAEPDVRQPIAIAFDDRGRLWVAESYSYAGSKFTDEPVDRILILEDADGDGVFEQRRVFRDGLRRLTGLAWGFGGIWVTTAPHLAFIPDRNGDDVPDGEPVVHVDGWTTKAEHNTVNGLTWGPDGWLYGRHGIKEPSRPGLPGTPPAQRTEFSCGLWRYHPTRAVFEIVADGTINPWGLDFDERGQMFMSTSVLDHLWHVVPGVSLTRWENRDLPLTPHTYELGSHINDHSHRSLAPGDPGGGHSHVDAMIYLGDRWPAEYRGSVFLANLMGRRINRDRLERVAPGGPFTARHAPDFLMVDDPWFRAVSLEYGPDGDVVMTDWSDNGECHDRDGVHRQSGRIYKLSWGAPRQVSVRLDRATTAELVELQWHRNDWHVRHARRLLQERAAAGEAMAAVHEQLRRRYAGNSSPEATLRALWALHATGGAPQSWLLAQLSHPEEDVRHWIVRLLTDAGPVSPEVARALVARAGQEDSWLARLALASALRKLPPAERASAGLALAGRSKANEDPNLTRLLWSGWEPSVVGQSAEALALAGRTDNARLRQWVARRVAEAAGANPGLVDAVLQAIASARDPAAATDLMRGCAAGLPRILSPHAGASRLRAAYGHPDVDHRRAAVALGAALREPEALAEMRARALDRAAPAEERNQAAASLAALQPEGWVDAMLELLARNELVPAAARALAAAEDPRIAPALLAGFPRWDASGRAAAVDALVSRPSGISALLDALEAEKVPRTAISAAQARQANRAATPELKQRWDARWGRITAPRAEAAPQITRLRAILKDVDFIRAADLTKGRQAYEMSCATCHRLFGQGGTIGPDLTGSGRKDLDYLLLNILDPAAVIAADYRLASATLADQRVVVGSVVSENADAVVLQTEAGPVTVKRTDLKSLERMDASLMPAGLIDNLSIEEVRDLFAYLMSDGEKPAASRP